MMFKHQALYQIESIPKKLKCVRVKLCVILKPIYIAGNVL